MIWLTLIVLINSVVPNGFLYEHMSVPLLGSRSTVLDILLFPGVLLTLLPWVRQRVMPVARVHPAFTAALILFAVATISSAVLGMVHAERIYQLRWYFSPFRNFVIVPVAMYMGYQVLRRPEQIRTVVWILFLTSLASAILMVASGGQLASEMGESISSDFDDLREVKGQSGDMGRLASAMILFSLIARVPFLPAIAAYLCVGLSAVAMLFVSHRSAWLMNAVVLTYATLVIWPTNMGRKVVLGGTALATVFFGAFFAILVVQQQTGKDYMGWVNERVESLMPDEETSDAKAWDTRIPGLKFDLSIWLSNPLLGGGFGTHEVTAIATNQWVSTRHTPWTSTLAESGLIGFAAFSVVIGSLIIVGTRLARTAPDRWMMLLGAAGACVGMAALVAGVFTYSWNSPRGALTLGLAAGLVLRCRDLMQTQLAYQSMPGVAHSMGEAYSSNYVSEQ